MATLIGVDEAGYGPNLGPLVVAATKWSVPNALLTAEALSAALQPNVHAGPVRKDPNRISIADSKQLYSPGGGLAELERSVLAALRTLGKEPTTWRELWPMVAPRAIPSLDNAPWRRDHDESLPIDAEENAIDEAHSALVGALETANVQLLDIRASVVFPAEFNRLLAEHGNKATGLSLTSLELVRDLLEGVDSETLVHCDKHGGRKRYSPLLQEVFPDTLWMTRGETANESVYANSAGNLKFRFIAKGDHFLPAALASMFAKYLREMAMRAFNRFWIVHAPGTKPTAGYPLDAKRFKSDIAEAQERLQVHDDQLWRQK